MVPNLLALLLPVGLLLIRGLSGGALPGVPCSLKTAPFTAPVASPFIYPFASPPSCSDSLEISTRDDPPVVQRRPLIPRVLDDPTGVGNPRIG